ncbi:hypothetical protein ABK040_009102 [Willaertia magna]
MLKPEVNNNNNNAATVQVMERDTLKEMILQTTLSSSSLSNNANATTTNSTTNTSSTNNANATTTTLTTTTQQNFIIIDVRDADFEGGNIKHAINIPYFDENKAIELANKIIEILNEKENNSLQTTRAKKQLLLIQQLQKNSLQKSSQLLLPSQQYFTIIFHCYYCRMRGPTASKCFLEIIQKNFPDLLKKIKIYYLKGGWSGWKKQFKQDERFIENSKQLNGFIRAVRK